MLFSGSLSRVKAYIFLVESTSKTSIGTTSSTTDDGSGNGEGVPYFSIITFPVLWRSIFPYQMYSDLNECEHNNKL